MPRARSIRERLTRRRFGLEDIKRANDVLRVLEHPKLDDIIKRARMGDARIRGQILKASEKLSKIPGYKLKGLYIKRAVGKGKYEKLVNLNPHKFREHLSKLIIKNRRALEKELGVKILPISSGVTLTKERLDQWTKNVTPILRKRGLDAKKVRAELEKEINKKGFAIAIDPIGGFAPFSIEGKPVYLDFKSTIKHEKGHMKSTLAGLESRMIDKNLEKELASQVVDESIAFLNQFGQKLKGNIELYPIEYPMYMPAIYLAKSLTELGYTPEKAIKLWKEYNGREDELVRMIISQTRKRSKPLAEKLESTWNISREYFNQDFKSVEEGKEWLEKKLGGLRKKK